MSHLDVIDLPSWNDDVTRTKDEVMAAFEATGV
jgi:hypothetical protein